MSTILIKAATIVNENRQFVADVLVKDGFIERIDGTINAAADKEINAEGLYLFPGCIDDQVHFREPGLTHKATIYTESRAAVAGGITTFMEMPNTVPNTLTRELLEEKYAIGARTSLANYSFYMGASNDKMKRPLKATSSITKNCWAKIYP
jgi:dihydroorotase